MPMGMSNTRPSCRGRSRRLAQKHAILQAALAPCPQTSAVSKDAMLRASLLNSTATKRTGPPALRYLSA